jgi:hypothetical protein
VEKRRITPDCWTRWQSAETLKKRFSAQQILLTVSGVQTIDVINPANEEIIGQVPRGTAEEAARAVRAAREGGKPFCENRDEVEWTAAKHVHLDYKQELKPYWYPYSKYNGSSAMGGRKK